jgi:hypothetical protein
VAALLLLLLAGLGAWALLGSDGRSAQTSEPGSGGREQAGAAQRRGPEGKPDREAAGAAAQDAEPPERSSDDAVQAEAGLTPPLAQAEQAVFDMYYEMSFARPEASYDYLSERLQNEIGSVEQWAQREDIYTFEYMDFEGYQYPVAEASGNEAEVTFEVRLDHTWGSEVLSGTWVCVNEDGEWKLDRLENAKTVPL